MPLDAELLGDFGGEGANAKNFRRVVTAGIQVETKFLSHVEMVLAEFAAMLATNPAAAPGAVPAI